MRQQGVLIFYSQRSKLTFLKSRLLATFNCKMVAMKKIQSPKTKSVKGRTLHDMLVLLIKSVLLLIMFQINFSFNQLVANW